MTKWFVVGTESITAEQEKSFIDYIKDNGFGWWHWIPNFWLITGEGSPSCIEIRDELHKLAPGKDIIVVEFKPVTWAGVWAEYRRTQYVPLVQPELEIRATIRYCGIP